MPVLFGQAGENWNRIVPIRFATRADIPSLMALERDSPTAAHWSKEQYEAAFSSVAPRRVTLVLEEDGLQGFLVGQASDKEWELENVVVANHARRCGLGTELVREFLRLVSSTGGEDVFLEVRESNLAARKLYEKLQFAETGRRRTYYQEPEEDAILYHRSLAGSAFLRRTNGSY
jgi:ribosomal-protein-alanine N-acetyltransferase